MKNKSFWKKIKIWILILFLIYLVTPITIIWIESTSFGGPEIPEVGPKVTPFWAYPLAIFMFIFYHPYMILSVWFGEGMMHGISELLIYSAFSFIICVVYILLFALLYLYFKKRKREKL